MRLGGFYMARKTISISDGEVLKYLNDMSRGVRSKYIVDLIRKDMKGVRGAITEEDVIKLILQYGGDKVAKEKMNGGDERIKNSIKSMINM